MPQETSVFDQFTGKYQLSKTLRFELKPLEKTRQFLKDNKVFEKDKAIDDHYHEIKYYFDTLHREFIQDALSGASFSVASYEKYKKAIERLKAVKNEDKKGERKHVKDIEAELRAELAQRFEEIGNNWKKAYAEKEIGFKKEGTEILFEEAILEALQKKFQDTSKDSDAPPIEFTDPSTGEKKNLFGSFKGFFTYFSNFSNTKRNLYSAEEQDTAVANRAINENLHKFIDNIIQFNEKKDEYAKTGLTPDEERIFYLTLYDKCFTQDGIDTYNRIIGGYTEESGEKIQGINEKINFYNQQRKDKKLPQFGQLFKQIMSKKDRKVRVAEIKSDDDVFKTLQEFIALNDEKLKGAKRLVDSFLVNDDIYDINRVYVKESALNTISNKWFSNWSVIRNILGADGGSKRKSKKLDAETENKKLPNLVSFGQLKNALESRSTGGQSPIAAKDLFREDYRAIYSNAKNHYEAFLKIWDKEWRDCLEEYSMTRGIAEKIMSKESYRRDSEEQVAKIKAYCDAALAVFQMMKYFALEKGRKPIVPENGSENAFYNPFNAYYRDYPVPAYYNEFRNYFTRKAHLGRLLFPSFGVPAQRHPLSKRVLDGAEKIKLNFEKGNLLGGWSESPPGNTQYCGYLLRRDGKYFLAVTDSPTILDTDKHKGIISIAPDAYEKMTYKQLKSQTIYGSSYEALFGSKYKKDKEKLSDKELIKRIKQVLEKQQKNFPVIYSVIEREFNKSEDVAKAINELILYSLVFDKKVDKNFVEKVEHQNDGKKKYLYVFEIYSKDFSIESKGRENLHTFYFRALFQKEDLKNQILKLSGGAEIFFRPKNEQLSKKIDKRGKEISDHKRYGEDKVFLHIPIVLNIGAGGDFGFNSKINSLIAEKKNARRVKIIGVDRGEKHLAYYAVIDQEGNLIDSPDPVGDLDGKLPNESSYLKKLEEKAGGRDEARKEWKTIENIKELKSGYISWVVRKLADMMLNENAILVFEDLTIGFKRGRQKIEQQVYQKLELALTQKLNYLVQKNAPAGVAGHHLKAYQLTPQVQTPQNIGKQCGAVFYVSPGYTSLTCPQCGYHKNITFPFENIEKARALIKKINLAITSQDNGFIVAYTLSDKENGTIGKFKVCSMVKRVRWHRNETDYAKNHRRGESVIEKSKSKAGIVKRYDITECLMGLFEDNSAGIKRAYTADDLVAFDSAEFYRNLFRYLDLLLRSRNSVSGTDIDYIQCPKCLFHSDDGFQGQKWNGDANGAYNIARKGLLLLKKIQNAKEPEKISWKDLKISVGEWDEATARWAKESGITQ